jgi:hypothetical protein
MREELTLIQSFLTYWLAFSLKHGYGIYSKEITSEEWQWRKGKTMGFEWRLLGVQILASLLSTVCALGKPQKACGPSAQKWSQNHSFIPHQFIECVVYVCACMNAWVRVFVSNNL